MTQKQKHTKQDQERALISIAIILICLLACLADNLF